MRTLLDLLETQAREHAERRAFTFLEDDGTEESLTYRELDLRARRIAVELRRWTRPGDRALLVYPTGLDFVSAFFGCVYAGVLPVPATYPKPKRPMPRLAAIAKDCQPTIVLTSQASLEVLDVETVAPELAAIRWLPTDRLPNSRDTFQRPQIHGHDLAFLQYTSGSTSEPKGVMVSHDNLLHNMAMILHGNGVERSADKSSIRTGAFWLPAHHDMGLICGILGTVFEGGHSVLMSPMSFLRRPIRWLEAISKYRAAVSGAPNFAYELCVAKTTPEERCKLDLSSWQVAFCSAEPVRAETLEKFAAAFAGCGFREEAFYPCYGLAEATLMAAGGNGPALPVVKHVERTALAKNRLVTHESKSIDHGTGKVAMQRLVSCGRALLDQQIVTADPHTLCRVPAGRIGEILIKGPSVARGYWDRADESERTFRARLADNGDGPFLRTGDLGFFSDGQLYVTGRLKDLIIIRGQNHYPQDIEQTVVSAHPAALFGGGAAFSTEIDGEERLVVVQEIDRHQKDADMNQILRCLRAAITREHALDLFAVVLIRQASLPRTTSGKPQRHLCRTQFLAGDLKVLAQWRADAIEVLPHTKAATATPAKKLIPLVRGDRPLDDGELDRLTDRIEAWLLEWLVERAGVPKSEVARDRAFAEFGLDSLKAVEMSQELETWLGVELSSVIAWKYPTPDTMSRHLARLAGGRNDDQDKSPELDRRRCTSAFERLLAEVESLGDEEATSA